MDFSFSFESIQLQVITSDVSNVCVRLVRQEYQTLEHILHTLKQSLTFKLGKYQVYLLFFPVLLNPSFIRSFKSRYSISFPNTAKPRQTDLQIITGAFNEGLLIKRGVQRTWRDCHFIILIFYCTHMFKRGDNVASKKFMQRS